MLNDPTMLEGARVLAAKVLQENSTPEEKINEAFRKIICRKPTANEMDILTGYYNEQLHAISQTDAGKLIKVGESPVPAGMNKITLAAMMKVIDTIYNLEEAITKT